MPLKNKRMKVEKFKVLLYLKKSGRDKFGKAPIEQHDGAIQLQAVMCSRVMESTGESVEWKK